MKRDIKFTYILRMLLLALALLVVMPTANAFADPNPNLSPLNTCANNPANDQGLNLFQHNITTKLITCIKGTIRTAVDAMLTHLSIYMKPITTILMVFAVTVFGMRILGGEPNIKAKAAGFLIRMGLVTMFAFEMGDYTDHVIAVLVQLTIWVSQGTFLVRNSSGNFVAGNTPWEQMDHYMGIFLGFSSGATLLQGFLGIVTGVMFSTTAGILMFITGAMAVLNIFFFAIRVIFCYLTSYLIICFLIILSPLIIPLALFYWTERYFTKWLHIMISAMLTPMILFAFLSMFLKIFGQLIGELFCPLGFKLTDLMLVNPNPDICRPELGVVPVDAAHPIDFRAFFRMNQPLISWLMPHDAGADTELQSATNTTDVGTSAVQSNINPMARRAMDAGSAGVPGVDFGPGTIQTVQSLVLSFIKLWIFGTIMTTMVKKIPAIASDMAGVNSVSSIGPTKLESESMRAMNNFKNRFSAGLKDKNEFYQIAKKEIRPY